MSCEKNKSWTDWIPLYAIILAALLGGVTYVWQKSVDRVNSLVELRQNEYTKFIGAYQQNISTSSSETLMDYHQATQRLFVVASDNVLLAVGALNDYLSETSRPNVDRSTQRVAELTIDVYRAMRSDCFEKTRITDELLSQILPFE